MRRLLRTARWDADGVRDDLRTYVAWYLGHRDGVLIVDETGFVKRGQHSVGVARQYTGTTGTKSLAQVGVFLAYASAKGMAFVDRALYLPRSWSKDFECRALTRVPKGLRFATKIALAQRMHGECLRRAGARQLGHR